MLNKMNHALLLAIILLGKVNCYTPNDEINFYEELIRNNLEIVKSYEPPTYYRGFEVNDENAATTEFGSYDFIIIGGGTAGSLLASRLSENKRWNILVLEAGGYENDFTNIPSMSYNTFSSNFNWGFTTFQDTNCPGSSGSVYPLPRGKALGGSSVINGNVFSRGSKEDYDNWASIGLDGWSFDQVLPYFKRFEDASALKDIDVKSHGFNGPLTIENYKNTSRLSEAFIESINLFGYKIVDYNSGDPIGVGYIQKSTKNGQRSSGLRTFLKPHINRQNLVLKTNSLVTRILIENNTARGVEFISDNQKFVVRADVEVIVSAGTFQSPQILMLSGIGPEIELSRWNIPVVLNLPVGQNFQDQYNFGVTATTNYTIPLTVRSSIAKYLQSFGPLTTSGGMELVTFYDGGHSITEIITYVTNSITLTNGSLVFDAASSVLLSFWVALLHPLSSGSVRLASPDPLQFPIIDPNFLAEAEDVETLVETVKFLSEVLKAEPLKEFGVTILDDSNCSNFTFKSSDYWRCVIRCSGGTNSHPSGTCKMGLSGTDSVVDSRLLVHGMKNLRVVDASVIPVTITGHMFATAYMIAEKAADFIKEDYGISK